MTDLRFRLNLEIEDVELVLNDKVVDTVGTEVVASWVSAINEKHGVGKEPVVEELPKVEEPAPVEAPTESVPNTPEKAVDDAKEE